MAKPSVIIIGAGVCGLAIGWQLLKAGAKVTIFDQADAVGTGATNRSGGMLAGGIENEPSEAKLWALSKYSQSLWADFKDNLQADSTIDIDYRNHGTMMVATNSDDLAHIQFLYDYQIKLGVNVQMLSARDIKHKQPHLKTTGGMFCQDDHQVDSVLLGKALAKAFENCGGKLVLNTAVQKLESSNKIATGVSLKNKLSNDTYTLNADKIVLCAGVNSPTMDGIGDTLPIRPLKGQMLSLQMDTANPILEYVVWTPKTYLIPKSDGSLLIGATVEEQGFDNNNTAGGIYSLLDSAWRALPAIEDLPIKDIWVGHRPTSRDDAPILGRLSMDNAYVATGHHRNGILLCPATAKIMTAIIMQNDVDLNQPTIAQFIQDFSCTRF